MKKPQTRSKKKTIPAQQGINQQLPSQVRKQISKHYVNKYGVAKKS